MKPRRLIAWAGSLAVTTCAGAWAFGSLVGGFGPLLPHQPQPVQPGPGPQRAASEPSSAHVFTHGDPAHSTVDGIVPVSLSGPPITAAPLVVRVRIIQREPGPARAIQRIPAARGSSAGGTSPREVFPAVPEPPAPEPPAPEPPAPEPGKHEGTSSQSPMPAPAGTAGEAPLSGISSGDVVRQWVRAALAARAIQSDHKVTRQNVATTRAAGTGTITTGVGRGQARGKPGG
jgi:hypothetical protein